MIRRLGGLLLLLCVIAGGGMLYLLSSLPQLDGRIVVKGPTHAIRIARDADGVPLIEATTDQDIAFGLGFAHAQDRLFQMELMRRYGAGRLAEIVGADAVPVDRQMRVLGIYRAAAEAFASLPAAVQRSLEAYSAGVNAFLAQRRGALPPEFMLLRFAPEPWRPADSLVWGKLMDLQLGFNYRNELERARLARSVSAEDLALLYPEYPKDAPTTLAGLSAIYRRLPLDRLYAELPPFEMFGPIYASNNWVVDGAHNASGKPLVANDPHLGFSAPGVWYLARLKTPQRDIAGATAPGVPLVIIGHNERIAWGFTTTTADIEDVFIEKIDPADPSRYLTPSGTAAFETRQETIAVRGAASVALTVRSTRHGPVLSDILPDNAEPGYVLALSTTYLGSQDSTAASLYGLDRAQDAAGVRAALADFVSPPQNVVYADDAGTIGFIMAGRVPARQGGNGWMPVPGWTGEHDWIGLVPLPDAPQAQNPSSGHFASANNKIVPDNYSHFVSRDWDAPYRITRIERLLDETSPQSPERSATIQADVLSLMAQRLVPLMTAIQLDDDPAREALERLRAWDFRMDADRVEPLLFIAWLREFAHSVFFNRLGAAAADYWNLKPMVITAILTERQDWCGSPEKPEESCNARLADTLRSTLMGLQRSYGPDMAQWICGRAHIASFPNRIFDRIPLLRDWFQVAVANAGGPDTVDVGPISAREDAHPYIQRFGPGLRVITDLAAPSESRMITVPGQSGNPLSSHFSDLLMRWRQFEWLVPGRAQAVNTLILEPAP
jgi:penicillin amidase